MKTNKYKRIDPSLALIELTTAPYGTTMGLDRCDGLTPSSLYLVTLTRQIPNRYPVVSMFYCIAPDADEAIAQVISNAFPEDDGCIISVASRNATTATAVQIPVHIRGWGRHTF